MGNVIIGTDGHLRRKRRNVLYDAIGRRIKETREAQGLNRAELSRRTGVDCSTIERVEEGGMPIAVHALVAIAEELDVTLDDLVPIDPEEVCCAEPAPRPLVKSAQQLAPARRAPPRPGSANPCAKLTEDAVREMRRLAEAGETSAALARRYGVSQSVAARVINRLSWRHVA
jgi:DNA-binding Xre family transcriptional regulator